ISRRRKLAVARGRVGGRQWSPSGKIDQAAELGFRRDPSHIFQSLIALLAGCEVPFLCADSHELTGSCCFVSLSGPPLASLRAMTTADSSLTTISVEFEDNRTTGRSIFAPQVRSWS